MWFLSLSLFEVIFSHFAAPGMNVNIHNLIGGSLCTVLLFLLIVFIPSNHSFVFNLSTFVLLSFVKAFLTYGPNKPDKSI